MDKDEALRYFHKALPGHVREKRAQYNLDVPPDRQAEVLRHVRDYLRSMGMSEITLQDMMKKKGGQQPGEFFIAEPVTTGARQRQVGLHLQDHAAVEANLIERFGTTPPKPSRPQPTKAGIGR